MSTFIGMGVNKKISTKEENKKIKELTATVEVLTKKNGELEAEKLSLTEMVDTLTEKVEKLTATVEASKKNKNQE